MINGHHPASKIEIWAVRFLAFYTFWDNSICFSTNHREFLKVKSNWFVTRRILSFCHKGNFPLSFLNELDIFIQVSAFLKLQRVRYELCVP